MALTEAGLASLLGVVRQPPLASVTLHEWDDDWRAYEDREADLFGRQVANRVMLVNGTARIENPQPGYTRVHWIIWSGEKPWCWSGPVTLCEGDTVDVNLRRDLMVS